ncbi:hypothetical protein CCYA_CCYA12G3346 [Cyanidiococcus yangmingshanensis]|nr:hypothetical protein CCYA_CCYA12G3346 [Cyanidiococcus yangmingshanensis]
MTGVLAVSRLTTLSVSFGTATALAFYVAYWGLVGRLQKRGPVPDILDIPGLRQLFRLVALAELFVVYLAPLLAVLFAVGAPPGTSPGGQSVLPLAAVYFLPNMIMTAVNINLEGVFRRRRHLLVNYSSIAVNNLWRLTVYVLILLDEQRRRLLSTAGVPASAVTVLASFRSVAWTGFAISVLIMIIFEPVAFLALAPRSGIESMPAESQGSQKT